MNYIKLVVAAVALFLAYSFGHSVAESKGEAALNLAKSEFADERKTWADERAEINSKSLEAIRKTKEEAEAKEAQLRVGFNKAEKQYKLRIKELEDARKQADTLIADPGPDGGLWASVEAASCKPPGDSGDSSNVSKAAGSASRSADTLQCRLTTKVAQALVQIVSEADKKTELLNKCIDALAVPVNVLNPLPTDQPTSNK